MELHDSERNMANRHRGLVLTAILCLIALAPLHGGEANSVGNALTQQAKRDQTKADHVSILRSVQRLESASKNAERCEDIQARNGPDICAQWAAANAARDAAGAARISIGWNIAAFFALLLTLGATAWAAFASTKAAVAAEKAVLITEDATKRQMRAYVSISRVRVRRFEPGSKPIVSYKVENSGQTPALHLRTRNQAFLSTVGPDDFRIQFDRSSLYSKTDVGPGVSTTASNAFLAPLTQESYDDYMSGQATLIFAGMVSYLDAFGRLRRNVFRCYLDPRSLKNGKANLTACQRGNDSS